MPEAISNTSPLLYLHRAGVLDWIPRLFDRVWVPSAVVLELNEGKAKGYDVPELNQCAWTQIVEFSTVPSEWFALDLGAG